MKNLLLLLILLTSILGCRTNSESLNKEPVVSQDLHRELNEIHLSGSGYELGLQHGKRLKSEIKEIVTKWKETTAGHLNRNADEVIIEFFEHANFTESIQKWTPNLYEEVRGIADGSEQDFNDIFVLNLLDEFWVYLDDLAKHHCSDIGVPAMHGNPSYLAQNMDIESYTDGYQTLIRLQRSNDRPEQLILTHPGLIALNGMNEKGIGVCVNTIMQLKASTDGLPVAFVVRRIINTTEKEDLLHFIKHVNHASGQNYILGIREEVFSFEASANKVERHDPGNKNGTVYHTNHPIVNTDLKEWYIQFHPESLDEKVSSESNSYIRLNSLVKRISNKQMVNDAVIMESLRSEDDEKNPICRANNHTGKAFTFASTIMTLSETPYFQITVGPPNESEYVTYYFSEKTN